jgi:hypothetical protein
MGVMVQCAVSAMRRVVRAVCCVPWPIQPCAMLATLTSGVMWVNLTSKVKGVTLEVCVASQQE